MQMHLASFLLFGLGAFVFTYAALALSRRRLSAHQQETALGDDTLVFLLQDGAVEDANFAARSILEGFPETGDAIDRLRLYLACHFDDPDRLISSDQNDGDLGAVSRDGRMQILRQTTADSICLKVSFVTEREPRRDDIHSLRALENELATLKANTAAAPFLLWRQNGSGEITWVNQTYLDTVRKFMGEDSGAGWPLPTLFPSLQFMGPDYEQPHRFAVQGHASIDEAWYDCHTATVGTDFLCTAIPADEAVNSESRRREFTQTLTKTFAELAIGLAIFDRSRRLVLFNPALLDLTGLPTDFLTSRPSLVAFLDNLREHRVTPEPRDYRTWRTSIAELEAAAADGTYSETWSLPDGQTYHVTGRPHPDGAVALLFEDISAEMSLTRRFRAEIEQSQAVIDAFDDAVAVFSSVGQLTLSNQAYRALWKTDPDGGLESTDLAEATRQWHALSAPTPIWGDFREFARMAQDREEWTATVTLLDGRTIACRFIPQKAGATMAIFHIQTATKAAATELRKAV